MSNPTDAPPSRFNMARYCIGSPATNTPSKPALLVFEDSTSSIPSETWTYAQLEDATLRIASALKDTGLDPGARIMIRLDNTSAYALLFFGAIAGGFVPLPTSSQLTPDEAGFLLTDSGAVAIALSADLDFPDLPPHIMVFGDDDVANMIKHPHRADFTNTDANDPAYLIYTSGTTANPKGVLHAHRAAWGRRPMYQGWYGISPDDRMLHAGAFNWTYTLGTGLTDPWANGATSIIYTGDKDPTVWPRLITRTKATLFAAVPGVFRQILKYNTLKPGSLGALRHGLIAGEAPPASLFDDWSHATGTQLFEAIGMSEISTYISSSPTVPRKPGAIGKPQPGRRIAILPVDPETPDDLPTQQLQPGEPGLLAVHRSDPGLMLGYWDRPDEEAQIYRGDWFTGGDLAMIDEDGYITHLGRANDVMKALGYRVAPQEVEAVLAQHPDVAEVACTEINVRDDVSVIGAFVVLNDGAQPNINALQALASEHLAAYKRPREYHFIAALPRTANGKVRRTQLKAFIKNRPT